LVFFGTVDPRGDAADVEMVVATASVGWLSSDADSFDFDVPVFDVPGFDVPGFDVPGFDVPGFDVPGFDVLGFDVSGIDVSEGDCSDDELAGVGSSGPLVVGHAAAMPVVGAVVVAVGAACLGTSTAAQNCCTVRPVARAADSRRRIAAN
jgi:hypothetical protein